MKLKSSLIGLLVLLTLVSCKKKEEEASEELDPTPVADSSIDVSNKTATSFTLTWAAAADDLTGAADLQYKVVYSTSDNVNDVDGAEANGTVAMNWTANTLTTSLSSLQNSTNYYVAVLVKDAEGNIGHAGSSVLTLCTGKRIFLATNSNGNLGGKTGADSICNTQKPAGMGTVKAMLSDYTGINTTTGLPSNSNGRQLCHGNCNSTTLYITDWVLAANQRYCRTDYSKKVGDVGSTYLPLIVSEADSLADTATVLYLGFHQQFGNSQTNCSNWSSSSGQFVAGTTSGLFGNGHYGFLTGGGSPFGSCSSPASIVCVEQ